jgi:hypothetical protein
MRNSFLRKQLSFAIVFLLVISLGCKRTQIDIVPDPTPTPGVVVPVNDAPQVTASVSGIVLDESNAPIASAVVTSGTATTTTNTNGMFILNNISLSKENGSVTVVKAGYFKGIRSFKTTAGKNHSVRLQMMARVLSGTVNAAAGGTITSNGGATIIFPANAFVTSAGAAYTGTVNVYSRWIDPTAANLPFVIPGDLRGISTNGAENILETYGMVGAELADASGNVLKIATGKTAAISFPIPASLTASAPATIVLWHFDDASARWKENGTATKTGSTYTAQVDKFSFWNCDVANANFVVLDYTIINAATISPLVSTYTRIKRANGSYGYGYTNNAGFVSGLVPKNEVLILEVVSACNTVIYSQNVGPFTANTGLGNISVSLAASLYITFSGVLLNCSGVPVSNGYVSFYSSGGYGTFTNTNANGAFLFTILNCSLSSLPYTYQGTDNVTSLQSNVFSGFTNTSIVNIGNINACGFVSNADIYASGYSIDNTNGIYRAMVWKNGVYTFLPNGTYAQSVFVSGTDVYVCGTQYPLAAGSPLSKAKFWKNGIETNLTLGNTTAYANAIFVSGNDIYVAGYESNNTNGDFQAKLWKNGVASILSNGVEAKSVYVSGADVYVAGVGINSAVYIWKNGIATLLSPSGGESNSVFVSGTDVYVAGKAGGVGGARIWKNGIETILSNIFYSSANSVFVSGTDVYVAGQETNSAGRVTAKLWKNGIASNLSSGTTFAYANSVFLFGTDVYVGGFEETNAVPKIAKIWRNGLSTNLPGSVVSSVFVK